MVRDRVVALVAAVILVAGCGSGIQPNVTSAGALATPAVSTALPSLAPSPASTVAASPRPDLILLAMGDSIPYNSPDDCPGCRGYVDLYGMALAEASGGSVGVINRSRHTGLTIEGLLNDFANETFRAEVADADAITISIGYNDAPMTVTDDPCDGAAGDFPELGMYTEACIDEWADEFAGQLDEVFREVTDLRAGKPTLLTVINIYDWWRGYGENPADVDDNIDVVRMVLERQNADICRIAADHGALCADVHTAFNGRKHDRPSGALLAPDHSHPSQAGNDLIAETLIDLGFGPLVD